jgi:hemerythrin superfamily protein
MPTKTASTKTAAAKKPASAKTSSTAMDAIALLEADHKEVKAMFKEYQKLVDADAAAEERGELAGAICSSLTVHATIEEEIFYPAARESVEEQDLIDEAEVEHASAKDLIAQIESMEPDDELYDAKVKVLGEYIDHHVKEEEGQMFPKARKAKLDLAALGEALQSRKDELSAEVA